ncbi:hypothetical protein, partial [Methylobacter sp. BlB1]|uniref:hypothetical protein n=1 Tax=Methylobacter sp. BlB1 TaxID=2785914 RepID=UPI00351BABCE
MKQAGGADAQSPGLFAQASGKIKVEVLLRFFDACTVAPHVEQAERRRGLVDIAEHLAEKGFMRFRLHPEACLRDEVAER